MEQQLELFHDTPFSLRLTIEDALRIFVDNYWRNVRCYETTKANIRRIQSFFKNFYLDTISKADVERYRRFHKDMGLKDSTINRDHMLLSRMFRKFEEYKEGGSVNGVDFSRICLPRKNPAALVPRVKEQQFARRILITKEQKKILCSYADEDLCEIIDVLYWSQLRPCDLFAITDKNVDLQRSMISGVQKKLIYSSNPSGHPYKVPIPETKMAMFRRRITETKPGTFIFRKTNLRARWEHVRKLAGLPEAQLRDFRGAGTSFLLDNGYDVETVRKKGGWTTGAMIPRYDKRGDEALISATVKLAEN